VLSGTARFHCDGETFAAGPGDFVLLPVGLPHSFVVGPDEPLRALQISTPSGFEEFVAAVGEPAHDRRLPEPGPVDAAALGHCRRPPCDRASRSAPGALTGSRALTGDGVRVRS
jgi:hypothetical protein